MLSIARNGLLRFVSREQFEITPEEQSQISLAIGMVQHAKSVDENGSSFVAEGLEAVFDAIATTYNEEVIELRTLANELLGYEMVAKLDQDALHKLLEHQAECGGVITLNDVLFALSGQIQRYKQSDEYLAAAQVNAILTEENSHWDSSSRRIRDACKNLMDEQEQSLLRSLVPEADEALEMVSELRRRWIELISKFNHWDLDRGSVHVTKTGNIVPYRGAEA